VSLSRRLVLSFLSALALAPVRAQATYPERTVKIIVPFPAGGTTDILARLVGAQLERRLGQPFL
jgi:tripartite-type tricarboxylate transporter receptor subunit TctC